MLELAELRPGRLVPGASCNAIESGECVIARRSVCEIGFGGRLEKRSWGCAHLFRPTYAPRQPGQVWRTWGTRPISSGLCNGIDYAGTAEGYPGFVVAHFQPSPFDKLRADGKMPASRRRQPQRLKPNSLDNSYVRPKGRPLQSARLKIRIWTSLLMVRFSRPLACIRWMKSGVMLKMRIWINSSSVGW